MKTHRPRERNLVFRLSQEEYDSILAAQTQSGKRSLSEFIRVAVMGAIAAGLDEGASSNRIRELELRVRHIEAAVLNLEDAVKSRI
jgi:hypothetical protein